MSIEQHIVPLIFIRFCRWYQESTVSVSEFKELSLLATVHLNIMP